jgi:hypothetical protein
VKENAERIITKEFIMVGGKQGPEFDAIESPVFNPATGEVAYWGRSGDKEFIIRGDHKGPGSDIDGSLRNPLLVFSSNGRMLAYRVKGKEKEFMRYGEQKGPEFDEVGNPVFSPDSGRIAYRARQGKQWFVEVSAMEGQKTAAAPWSGSSLPVLLSKTVPRRLPHPVAVGGNIIGGAMKSRWVNIDAVVPPHLADMPPDWTGKQCLPLNQESIPSELGFKLYSFDRFLGECAASRVLACISPASGEPRLDVSFPGCLVKAFEIAIAGSWNAIPRRPNVLKNRQDFTPIVRKFLDSKGRKQAPVHIEYVHGIDLDGDGKEEQIINAR